MYPSLDDNLQEVVPHLPAALIAQPELHAMRRLARSLPQSGPVTFGSALAPGGAGSSFAVRLSRGSAAGRRLANPHSGEQRGEASSGDQAWKRVSEFVAGWVDPFAPLYALIGTVCLQWNTRAAQVGLDAPGVMFSFARDASRLLGEAALRQLNGRPLSPATRVQLTRCYDALPPPARVLQAGMVLAHSDTAIRLHISTLRRPQLCGYLARIGWNGPLDEIDSALAPFDELDVGLALNIDIGAGVARSIGIDCSFDACRDIAHAGKWSRLLDHLAAIGLCAPQKGAALLAWQGRHNEQLARRPEVVPELSHIRLQYEPGQPLSATAHWGFSTVWTAAVFAAP